MYYSSTSLRLFTKKFQEIDLLQSGNPFRGLISPIHYKHYIGRYGCKEYFAHNKELLFYERQKEIITELDDLAL